MQFLGIDDDLVLLNEAADACDFGDALGLGQLIAQIPVLDRAQLGERALRTEHDILVNPADAGRVGPERRGDPFRQPLGGKIQIFENARARPIKIGTVLEHDIDERHAEEGEAAHHLRARHREQCRGQRIGDLVLDHLRRLAGIFGVDDDLRVGEIRNGIERRALHGIDAGEDDESCRQQHQKAVAGRPDDDGADHGDLPSGAVKACRAARRLLSASIRKLAPVTTFSPPRSPSSTAT